ncbi:MAG: hypothetical protein AABY53_02860 [Bdellovibrionota bacterium]
MIQSLVITGLSTIFTLLLGSSWAQAQILGPSAAEVKFSYTTSFEAPEDNEEGSDEALAELHASHIFGIFSSPTLIAKYIGANDVSGGLGGPRTQMKIKILSSRTANGLISIKYSNSGKMILNKVAAKKILAQGSLVLPMPANPYEIYDKKCTDDHYTEFGDFWYFYDPFRAGCEHLSQSPMAVNVNLKITPSEFKKLQVTPKLPTLRGNNGNGDLFSIYIISGYDEKANKSDVGYRGFKEIQDELKQRGFGISRKRPNTNTPLNIYTKTITLDNGKSIEIEINHLLVSTDIGIKSNVFAKFFKEAVSVADVIVYGGHSGLGGNLDIPSLEEKAGKFKFNSKKNQIFFFDSCSSYSYYLEHFAVEKTKAKIDIMSNGLSSLFGTSTVVLFAFLDHLFSTSSKDVPWMTILSDMENTLGGDTYLLNVGGI